jgi:chorismate synthase
VLLTLNVLVPLLKKAGVIEVFGPGTPIPEIAKIIETDLKEKKYEESKDILPPSHAKYSYLMKYGIFDYLGSGRASARETAARVAASAIAEKILDEKKQLVIGEIENIDNINNIYNTFKYD